MTSKILIVDDEPYIRQLIVQSLEDLEDAGVTLLLADNGRDAVQMIQAEHPNMVFLDVMMPHMNGFEVCNIIKNELHMEDVYIVFLTAKGQEFDRRKGEQVGANVYLTKPFDPDDLLARAKRVLGLAE
jgi:DNA-binding response OmpR family regulator